jgi:hypothetical protein
LKSSEEGLGKLYSFDHKISEHLAEIEANKKKVTEAKMGAKEFYNSAMDDADNLDALKDHR